MKVELKTDFIAQITVSALTIAVGGFCIGLACFGKKEADSASPALAFFLGLFFIFLGIVLIIRGIKNGVRDGGIVVDHGEYLKKRTKEEMQQTFRKMLDEQFPTKQ
jgi:uncharacterized membrane protein HdeD (DUF308 family)